ncbi:thiolase family protein [Pseudonocardia acaciae]|uniref:thiolase family protein n=1 Tax=Pseudonocardia acaciae TaxID=551276 RepID=UPI00048F3F43|nr:thiolase family protein [Pseudonocardia acaciae]
MRDAVIVEALRTPVGTRDGKLSGIHPVDLSAHLLEALTQRTGIDPAVVDDVIWGCASGDIARTAVLAAGWPESVPGVTVDQQAVHFAAAGLVAGRYDVVVAGGVESASRVADPSGQDLYGERYGHRYPGPPPHRGIAAELVAQQWGFSRTQLDEFSLGSHEKAAAARDGGRFGCQLAPVVLPDGTLMDADEGIREGGTLDTLGALRTVFRAEDDGGVITAGNGSPAGDGAAAMLMTTGERAVELGLTPIARVHTAVAAGADPVTMLTAPIPATEKTLARSGLNLGQIGAFEVDEAFAPVPLAWLKDIGADESLLNPNGGAIALGHPLGAAGARLLATLAHHMRDQDIRYGLATMSEGGGQANATILELL